MSILQQDLTKFVNNLLDVSEFQDYGPNGLQIDGTQEIKKIAFAVSATLDSIEKAREFGAHALIVHHGLFWNFHGVRTITGAHGERVKNLIKEDINLYSYHLPLDANLEVGNAAMIAKALKGNPIEPFGNYKGMPVGVQCKIAPLGPIELAQKLEQLLGHKILLSQAQRSEIKTIGIITGGANSGWREAFELGLDAYLTGEMSEHDWHDAKEAGVHMFAGGHHATETFGIKALMKKVGEKFDLECKFINSDNPA